MFVFLVAGCDFTEPPGCPFSYYYGAMMMMADLQINLVCANAKAANRKQILGML